MYKLAIVGDSDSILAFQALGFDAYVTQPNNAPEVLNHQVRSGKYAVIFISETLAETLSDMLKDLQKTVLPVISILPTGRERKQVGLNRMREICIRATGTDVFSKMR